MTFWDTLQKPCFVLAPMADVTDPAFRRIIAKYGKPDVLWTEFVSADGLYHTREIQKMPDTENPLMHALQFAEIERPIVAQLFSSNPDMLAYGAKVVRELGFDGVDINMGCPDKAIEKQGAGAALMKNPVLACELVGAVREAVGSDVGVSVKTRIGYNRNELGSAEGGWLASLIRASPDLITVHARTRKEMSKVPARWEHVTEAVAIRDALRKDKKPFILGNGDLIDLADAREKVEATGADGAMLGRAIFGNPWLWSDRRREDISLEERLEVLYEHCVLFEELLPRKSFAVMKKHFASYLHGLPHAKEVRLKLMECGSAGEVGKTRVQGVGCRV